MRLRIEQFLSDARVVKECAGVSAGQIVLQQRAQVGFVIDIHFEVRIAAMVNLRAMSDGFTETLARSTTYSKDVTSVLTDPTGKTVRVIQGEQHNDVTFR